MVSADRPDEREPDPTPSNQAGTAGSASPPHPEPPVNNNVGDVDEARLALDGEEKPSGYASTSDSQLGREKQIPVGTPVSEEDEKNRTGAPANNSGDGSEGIRITASHATEASVATSRGSTKGALEYRKWYKTRNPLKWGAIPPVPTEKRVSGEHTAGFFSKLVFQWMAPLIHVGYRRPLEQTDIWNVNPDRSSEVLVAKLKESFQRRVKNGEKYPLIWSLHDTFLVEFWIGGFLNFIATLLQVSSPFTLRFLIQFATDAYYANRDGTPPPHIGAGMGLAFGITAMQIFQSLGINHFIYRGMMVGGQSRAVLMSLIFEKAMVLSGRAKAGDDAGSKQKDVNDKKKKEKKKKPKRGGPPMGPKAMMEAVEGSGWANGRIVNLMSVDTYRVDQACGLFHMIWTAPLSCLITLALLIVNLSYSALAGFALLVFGLPLLTRAIRSLFRRRKAINIITDKRVTLTQEILSSVRFVKYFGWETSFLDRLRDIRGKEIRSIQILLAIRNAINAISMSLPVFASMISFITYSLTTSSLAPAEVFSSLALFNGLRFPLNLLPLVIGQVVDAWSSIKRIQEFLLAEESEEGAKLEPEADSAIQLKDASFTWEMTEGAKKSVGEKESKEPPSKKGESKSKQVGEKGDDSKSTGETSSDGSTVVNEDRAPFQISDLNLAIGRNELVAVIGTVGSGKSSLLSAMAGEMRRTSGDVVLGASRALCPQSAWIQNATVRNNILFGKDMDWSWYKKVIHACALEPDLDMLPAGDSTEIGERGITISGGQKQRLNIARAIYFDADIVLMDDPLSAVDAHVGRHIFDKAILGLLGNKARVLATHQLWVLSRCDRIVWMEGGKIQAVDTFDNLMRDHAGFRTLLETTAVEKKAETKVKGNGDEDATEKKDASADDKKKKRNNKTAAALMQAEEKATAAVPWSTYGAYVRASGTILNAPLLFLLLLLSQASNIVTSLWLSWWTGNEFNLSTGTYIGVYAGLGASSAVLMFIFSVSLAVMGTTASKKLLAQAVTQVLRAPMSFFDTTPLGRITNRFSRDVDVMDNTLTDAMRMYAFTLSTIVSVFVLIISFFPYFAIALVPLFGGFMFAASYYRASAREVKRFESILRSTVFAKFGEGLIGSSSIKAYGLEERFVGDLRSAIDEMNGAYYLTFSNQRWLSVRLDMIGTLLVFTTAVLVVTSRFDVPPHIGGLVLSYILAIVQMIQFTVRQLAEVENGMNAVERLLHYGRGLEEEAPLHTVEVRGSWPEEGEIRFDDVEMRYRAGLPLVLKGLSMTVKGGERVGIVGRTGAGKSSIVSTLFRLTELSGGRVTVDGIDISTIGLHDLRSRLAIIPQDPTLFRGTVRSNLDPFGEHTDLELWGALKQAGLVPMEGGSPTTTTSPDAITEVGEISLTSPTEAAATPKPNNTQTLHLTTLVSEDGSNFSLGQRQLMALARALVRNSQIIVCDEATSSVDVDTDDRIQATMATAFAGRTLLVIAHRLRTILGYDRVVVLEGGRIVEVGRPEELFGVEGGVFRGMCERSGIGGREVEAAGGSLRRGGRL